MGLSSFLTKLLVGDPEERKFRKEVKAEAKQAEREAFREQYKIVSVEKAAERGKAKAIKEAEQKGSSGGFLNTLGKIGASMNAASKGLVADIEINPSGSNESFQTVDPFQTPTQQFSRQTQHTQKVFPGNKIKRKPQNNQPEFNALDPFDLSDIEI